MRPFQNAMELGRGLITPLLAFALIVAVQAWPDAAKAEAPKPPRASAAGAGRCGYFKYRDYAGNTRRSQAIRKRGRVSCRRARKVLRTYMGRVSRYVREERCYPKLCQNASPRGWRCRVTSGGEYARTFEIARCRRKSAHLAAAVDPD